MLFRLSGFLFIAAALAFGVFLVWQITSSSVLTKILNDSESVTVSATNGGNGPAGQREFDVVTLLPFDAIRSIEAPVFLSRSGADEVYSPDELVLGVEINDDARAYSVPLLSRHEVVNDEVGGLPIAVTW